MAISPLKFKVINICIWIFNMWGSPQKVFPLPNLEERTLFNSENWNCVQITSFLEAFRTINCGIIGMPVREILKETELLMLWLITVFRFKQFILHKNTNKCIHCLNIFLSNVYTFTYILLNFNQGDFCTELFIDNLIYWWFIVVFFSRSSNIWWIKNFFPRFFEFTMHSISF